MNNLMYNNELEGAKGRTCSLVVEKGVLVGEEELGRVGGNREILGTREGKWN